MEKFTILATFVFILLGVSWSPKNTLNVLVKASFILLSIYGLNVIFLGEKSMEENGKKVRCPECGSEDVYAVLPFDYIKQCRNCGYQFMTGEHN